MVHRPLTYLLSTGLLLWQSIMQLSAQTLPITTYTTKDGLPLSGSYDILQDQQGYLWFGGFAGLSKYDGYQFTNYSIVDGLVDNRIWALAEDTDNRLWIGTAGGVILYDGLHFSVFDLEYTTDQLWIRSIVRDSTGCMWIASTAGVYRYDGVHVEHFATGDGLENANTIAAGHDGDVWIGTYTGLSLYRNGRFHQYTVASGLCNPVVRAIALDTKGHAWIGTDNGVSRFDGNRFMTFTTADGLGGNQITAIECDHDGNLWFSTSGGLSKFDGVRFVTYTTEHGLPSIDIRSICSDYEGNLWVGTDGYGIAQIGGEHLAYFFSQDGKSSTFTVSSMVEDAIGHIWFATSTGAMHYDGDELTEIEQTLGLSGMAIKALVLDKAGHVWIGSNEGISRFDGTRFSNYLFPETLGTLDLWVLRWDSRDRLWLGTSTGVYTFDGSRFSKYTGDSKVYDDWINAILEDRTGALWFGSQNQGVARLDRDSTRTYTVEDGLPHNCTWSITEDPEGELWISTLGGLSHFDGDQFQNYSAAHGLSSNDCRFAVPDQHYLYVGTVNGICRFDPATKTATSFLTHFHARQNSFLKDSAGNLWFGAKVDGAVRYTPRLQRRPHAGPPVYITNVHLYDRPVSFNHAQEYSYQDNYFSFNFVGLWFTAPETIRYRYRLDGLDSEWIATGNRSVSYSYLRPGNYQFQVEARNGEGIWSPAPATWAFTIVPPFWAAWWFRLLMGAFLVIGLLSAHRFRTRVHKRRNRELEQEVHNRTVDLQSEKQKVEEARNLLEDRVQERTKQLRSLAAQLTLTEERARRQIAADLHDHVGQALAMTKIELVLLQQQMVSPEYCGTLDHILRGIEKTIQDARSLTFALSHPILYDLGLIEALDWLAKETQKQYNVHIAFQCDSDDIPLAEDLQILVFLAVRELLANIIRHARARNAVVSMRTKGHALHIVVEDDGIGFNPASVMNHHAEHQGFGLFSVRERLESSGGRLQIGPTPAGGGTHIEIIAPLIIVEGSAE